MVYYQNTKAPRFKNLGALVFSLTRLTRSVFFACGEHGASYIFVSVSPTKRVKLKQKTLLPCLLQANNRDRVGHHVPRVDDTRYVVYALGSIRLVKNLDDMAHLHSVAPPEEAAGKLEMATGICGHQQISFGGLGVIKLAIA